jgi:pyridoxal phosphate enzyme (YggS family)
MPQAESECAAAVISQCGLRARHAKACRAFASDKCNPFAPTRSAKAASLATRKTSPRARASGRNKCASLARCDACRARTITIPPRGSLRAAASGSGKRSSSVINTRGGNPHRAAALSARAALANLAVASVLDMSSKALPPATALADILSRTERTRAAAIQPAPSTTLIAVSKMQPADRIRPLLEAGHRVFGESRVQEVKAKWQELRAAYADVQVHLIGPLQTNKVREAVELFDAIHSIDRPKLAEALKAEISRSGRSPLLFIQVNTGEEPQKAGIAPQDARKFIAYCRDELALPVQGLMCIPPVDEAPAPHFALLRKLAGENGLPLLSIGMSGDFEAAIKFGATHVRVGSALFGERER